MRAAKVVKGKTRCPQCWQWRKPLMFIGKLGGVVKRCSVCRAKYATWGTKSFEEKLASRAPRPITGTGYRVTFVRSSQNRKLGGIPASMTDRASCPTTCSFRNHGCYAEFHTTGMHWDNVARDGMSWRAFCQEVASLPEGTLWRHNEAGDLPGQGDEFHRGALLQLVEANRGRRGFTFTHKDPRPVWNAAAISIANRNGFTINLSADTLEQADALADLHVGPVAVVLPHDATQNGNRTPAGRPIVVCPAQTHDVTCADCQLCANPTRKTIVGFRAHGQYKYLVTEIVRGRRLTAGQEGRA